MEDQVWFPDPLVAPSQTPLNLRSPLPDTGHRSYSAVHGDAPWSRALDQEALWGSVLCEGQPPEVLLHPPLQPSGDPHPPPLHMQTHFNLQA